MTILHMNLLQNESGALLKTLKSIDGLKICYFELYILLFTFNIFFTILRSVLASAIQKFFFVGQSWWPHF